MCRCSPLRLPLYGFVVNVAAGCLMPPPLGAAAHWETRWEPCCTAPCAHRVPARAIWIAVPGASTGGARLGALPPPPSRRDRHCGTSVMISQEVATVAVGKLCDSTKDRGSTGTHTERMQRQKDATHPTAASASVASILRISLISCTLSSACGESTPRNE